VCVYPRSKSECPSCRLKRKSPRSPGHSYPEERPHLQDRELSVEVGLGDPRVLERAEGKLSPARLPREVQLAAEARDAEAQKGTRSRRRRSGSGGGLKSQRL
jgi:hypothetical protein